MRTTLHPDGPAPHGGPGRPVVRAVQRREQRHDRRPDQTHDPRPDQRRELRLPLATGLAGLAAVTYLAVSDPYRPGRHLVCPLLALTGWYCPGCGAQRAVHSLAHGDLAAAWDMNPLLVVAAPVAVAAWVRWLVRRPAGALHGAGDGGDRGDVGPDVGPDAAPDAAPHRRGSVPRRLSVAARTRVATVSAWVFLAVVVAFAVLRNVPALGPWLAP